VPRFREAAEERGVRDAKGRGLGVTFGDLDADGDIDLYVANDGTSNLLLLNDGAGHFKDWTLISGTGYSETGEGEAGMGTALGDFDNDGLLDIIVTNFARQTNALYHNDGGGMFTHATIKADLHQASLIPLGWGTRFFDADLDGDDDLFVANGHIYEEAPIFNPLEIFVQPNQMFRNNGDGAFTDVSEESGPGLSVQAVSRGVALGDIDNDGDLDLYVANHNGPGTLLLNDSERDGRRALRLSLTGGPSNRDAIGTRLEIQAGDLRLKRQATAGGSYLSHSDLRLLFGVGTAAQVDLRLRWPSGKSVELRNLPLDILLHLPEN